MAFWQALRTWAVFALNCAFQANCSHTLCSTTKDTLHYIWLGLDLSTGGDLFIPKVDMEWEGAWELPARLNLGHKSAESLLFYKVSEKKRNQIL